MVCGDRHWTDREAIREVLEKLWKEGYRVLIEGGADGADKIAGEEGTDLAYVVIEVKANWKRHHNGAGPVRNAVMLTLNPDLVVAFHHDLANSKGTANMVKQARKAGVRLEVIGWA